jgi:quercetin dioxygenase-like cupin family protein
VSVGDLAPLDEILLWENCGRATTGGLMSVVHGQPSAPMTDDPDDYRPNSSWRLAFDPEARVDMTVIYESVGVGDRIPRHVHDVDEVILVEGGSARIFVDGVETEAETGTTVFIPAGTIHGTVNAGEVPVEVRAMFATTTLRMDLVERNPMPGTEGQPPMTSVYYVREDRFEAVGPSPFASTD